MYNEFSDMRILLKNVNKITNFKKQALVSTHSTSHWDINLKNIRLEDLCYELQENLAKRLNANLIMILNADHQMQLENLKFIANPLIRFTKSISLDD